MQEPSARWDNFFLNLALANAMMSKDPNTKVGAVIVGPDREVRASGFNGFPRGIADAPERLCDRDMKLQLVVHGEMNAVLAAARVGVPLKGCTLYVACTDDTGQRWGGSPCVRCTVEVIQAGVTEVVSWPEKRPTKWEKDLRMARAILNEAGIPFREIPLV